jgi:hypothetical protein
MMILKCIAEFHAKKIMDAAKIIRFVEISL